MVLGGSIVIYAGLAWSFRLTLLAERARVSIGTLTGRGTAGAVSIAVVGLALYGLYLAAAVLLWRSRPTPRLRAQVWLGAALSAGLLLLCYPVTSTDIWDYLFRGRLAAEYAANPYLQLPREFKSDPFYAYIGWPNAPSAYGPLWETASAMLARLGGGTPIGSVLVYKAASIGAFLLCGAAIEAGTERREQRLLGAFVWLWSPLALWEFAGAGHNDALLVLSLLGALLAVQRGWYALAIAALTLGALFKFLPIVFVPLVMTEWLRRRPELRARSGILLAAAAIVAVPTVLMYAPYWDLPPGWTSLPLGERILTLVAGAERTLRNVRVREGFLNAAPLAVVSYLLQQPAAVGALNALLQPLGYPELDARAVRSLVSTAGTVLLVLGLVYQCRRLWLGRCSMRGAFWGLLLWYLLACSQWFQPWYALWLLGIFALEPDGKRFAWLSIWAMAAQASYLLQYIVLPNMGLSGQTLLAQTYYLLLIYALPLAAFALAYLLQRRRAARAVHS